MDATANRATYRSGGIEVSGFFYKPSGNGPFPAVLVLHGKSGLDKGPQALASWLATQGYVAFAVDYFTPIGMTPEKFDISFYLNNVDQAREVQAQGLESFKSLLYVDPTRIGVVGQSLGGYFALILATRDDVKGVISYYGAFTGSPVTRTNTKYTMADIVAQVKVPVLMFQGDKDELVPIANANATQNLLVNSGKKCEYYTYPGVGHAFDIKGALTYDANAATDSQQKALAFLKAKLP